MSADAPHIILLGPPASGKGTQSRFLTKLLGVPALSTGLALREHIEKKTTLGLQAQSYMNQGSFVPDELVNQIVFDWIDHHPEGWILDGYPRTRQQAEALSAYMQKNFGKDVGRVMWLQVSREELEDRIRYRRECPSCHQISRYLGEGLGVCSKCEVELSIRPDDNLESFARRWKDYGELTVPVGQYYEELGLVCKIDSSVNPQYTGEQLQAGLTEFLG